ncbi:MAG: VWA domain-containing protein [Acidobacteria bacterium]|nr:MAG: VWA domain-containing protein [Acidobacteriota bacterium]
MIFSLLTISSVSIRWSERYMYWRVPEIFFGWASESPAQTTARRAISSGEQSDFTSISARLYLACNSWPNCSIMPSEPRFRRNHQKKQRRDMTVDRDRRTHLLLSIVLLFLTRFSLGVDAPVEVRRFPVSAGDTLLIQIDYGRVNVHPRPSGELEAHLTKQAKTAQNFQNIEILGQKQGNKIYLNAYFYDYQGDAVAAEIWAPPDLNVVIWGANPNVQIAGMSGYVRVHSLTGGIAADDLTASTSLMTDSGDIVYRARKQPGSDVRMESVSGSILCELKDDLNFRGWARAGGKLRWNGEIEMDQGSLERQIGLGGPLCYASSLKGQVEFRLRAQLAERQADPHPPELSSERQDPQRRAQEPPTEGPVSVPSSGQAPGTSQGPVSQDASGTYNSGYKLKLEVDWIYLNASVRERKTNRSVPNLQKTDFEVYEDGNQQEIGRFLETEEPFHLLLLIDVSGSTQEYLDLIQDASIQFTRQIGPEDEIAIATFNSKYRLRQDFTGDRARAVSAIQQIRSGGGTAVYDALLEAINHMSRLEGRKAVVLFSDGVDNQLEGNTGDGSRATFQQLYREIQEADALIYTIFLDTEDSAGTPRRSGGGVIDILGDILRGGGIGGRRPGGGYPTRRPSQGAAYEEARQQMEMIADQTGGRMYAPNRIQDLSRAYTEIADDLRIQYTLGYNSTNASKDGAWRKVKVSIANRPDLVVRTRKGYYSAQQEAKNTGAPASNYSRLGR